MRNAKIKDEIFEASMLEAATKIWEKIIPEAEKERQPDDLPVYLRTDNEQLVSVSFIGGAMIEIETENESDRISMYMGEDGEVNYQVQIKDDLFTKNEEGIELIFKYRHIDSIKTDALSNMYSYVDDVKGLTYDDAHTTYNRGLGIVAGKDFDNVEKHLEMGELGAARALLKGIGRIDKELRQDLGIAEKKNKNDLTR